MIEKYYGILDDTDLIYGEGCYKDLKDCIKDALRLGATGFMIGDFGDLNKMAYEICKNLQTTSKTPFKITIISTKLKDKDIIDLYKDDNILFVYSEVPSSYHFTMSKINRFIINNTFKCFTFSDDTKYFDRLTTGEFYIINPANCKENYFPAKEKIVYEPLDSTNIHLIE